TTGKLLALSGDEISQYLRVVDRRNVGLAEEELLAGLVEDVNAQHGVGVFFVGELGDTSVAPAKRADVVQMLEARAGVGAVADRRAFAGEIGIVVNLTEVDVFAG